MAKESETIWGGPTKRFFVSMLTRDIPLEDSILDLIDNCVDGASRLLKGKVAAADAYNGYWARLTLSNASFDITDNCGGIPEDAIADAFLLGRPRIDRDKNIPTIGMYGIGMKRAIFKIGEEAMVHSFSNDGAFEVTYDRKWLDPANDDWELPILTIANKKLKGVSIIVPSLRSEISRQFGNAQFQNGLKTKVAEHFGYLMQKGFKIFVNDEAIRPQTLRLYAADVNKKNGIRPYDYEATTDGNVKIRVTVGFFRPLSHLDEIDEETEKPSEAEQAGISVVCNDRLVLINDTSSKTGWGDGGVPKFHPQFRGIAGFIVFSTPDPSKLPISTTKRDLEVGSDIFLQARKYCMEGLRECTDFTNKWKGMETEANTLFYSTARKDVRSEVRLAEKHGRPVRGSPTARKLPAELPVPEKRNPMRRISFTRKEADIRKVAVHLFEDSERSPSDVGQECFDKAFREAKRR